MDSTVPAYRRYASSQEGNQQRIFIVSSGKPDFSAESKLTDLNSILSCNAKKNTQRWQDERQKTQSFDKKSVHLFQEVPNGLHLHARTMDGMKSPRVSEIFQSFESQIFSGQ